jgi:hypothetical protein
MSLTLLPVGRVIASRGVVTGAARWTDLGNGVLRDQSTTLEWTQEDNGTDIDWNDSKTSCSDRGKGWRLPSLQELKSIFDPTEPGVRCAETQCKVSSQFHLTGPWFWSATQVGADSTDGNELAWGVLLVNGAQTQAVRDASYGSRTLCVREPGTLPAFIGQRQINITDGVGYTE